MFGVIPLVEFLGVLGFDIDVHQKNPSAFVCHVSVPSVAYRFHRVASSRVHPPSRLKPMQDEHKLCKAASCTSGCWASVETRQGPLCMGRLSHALMPHTTLGLCRTKN